MHERLAEAFVELVRRIATAAVHEIFVRVEGVAEDLAIAISDKWDDQPGLPRLGIAASDPDRFPAHGLVVPPANVRNDRIGYPDGVCLLISRGYDPPDRASINFFDLISEEDLLDSPETLMFLSRAAAPVRPDGPAAAVREAILAMDKARRPRASQVADYFDLLAAAEEDDPLGFLPALGGFRDKTGAGAEVGESRVRANLELAKRFELGEVAEEGGTRELRRRATRVLGRNRSIRRDELSSLVDDFIRLLDNRKPDILSLVWFEEAQEILEQQQRALDEEVREELDDFKRTLEREEQEAGEKEIEWEALRGKSRDLVVRDEQQRSAAQDLLGFDQDWGEVVFTPRTRKGLLALLRDSRASITTHLETSVARAIVALDEKPRRVEALNPEAPEAGEAPSTEYLASRLVLAGARLRGRGIWEALEAADCEVDETLMSPVFADPGGGEPELEEIRALFESIAKNPDKLLKPIELRLRGAGDNTRVVPWLPDVDDLALLRCLAEFSFSAEPALTLRTALGLDPRKVAFADDLVPADVEDQQGLLPRLARKLQETAAASLASGLDAATLKSWAGDWASALEQDRGAGGHHKTGSAVMAGCVQSPAPASAVVAITPLAPPKAEWLAQFVEAGKKLFDDALGLVQAGEGEPGLTGRVLAFETSARGLDETTASHCPAFLRMAMMGQTLQPENEWRVWSVLSTRASALKAEGKAVASVEKGLRRLLRLRPEAASHLRCIAIGQVATSILLELALEFAGKEVEGVRVEVFEILAVGTGRPDAELEAALANVDAARTETEPDNEIRVRYVEELAGVEEFLGPSLPVAHMALVTGLLDADHRPMPNDVEFELLSSEEVLFAPRISQRPDSERRVVLAPPSSSGVGTTWLRANQAIDDRWPDSEEKAQVPEVRTELAHHAPELVKAHELADWVLTLDPYATRESLEQALGEDVAILHQDQRLGSNSPLGLVISQVWSGPVDRAIGHRLKGMGIFGGNDASQMGTDLRKVATQGHAVLALEAATTGTGINELIGHVTAFAMLGEASTPWPLPPDCRIVLVSLDEQKSWFHGGRRADLLAVAIDGQGDGIHAAVIEIKARTSAGNAPREAVDQVKRTLVATARAHRPRDGDLSTRIWLNRIAEAVYAVARESRIRLTEGEIRSLEKFRAGTGTNDFAGMALVFVPGIAEARSIQIERIEGDPVPIVQMNVDLSEKRLKAAVDLDLREIRTVLADESPLPGGGRTVRRPEKKSGGEDTGGEDTVDQVLASPGYVIGWDVVSGDPVYWRPPGMQDALPNGHIQIWGSSGGGKTDFLRMLLGQLCDAEDFRLGIADFKNDYGPVAPDQPNWIEVPDFPTWIGADFIDMWGNPGAPYNPLALTATWEQVEPRRITEQIMELRDVIGEAVRGFAAQFGVRQRQLVKTHLESVYDSCKREERWPTMLDLHRDQDPHVAHLIGDLTEHRIFDDGPPLGDVVDQRKIFGFEDIPGDGQTTTLAAGFLLSSIWQKMQNRGGALNAVNYTLVVDEAHRVKGLKALENMLRMGRSKGLAVILATQSAADLPSYVHDNAQSRICFRILNEDAARAAAQSLGSNDLAGRIRNLADGEAIVTLGGSEPRKLRMVQCRYDWERWKQSKDLTAPRDD